MKYFIYLTLFLTACNQPTEKESNITSEEIIDPARKEIITKTKEVMEVHDFAMEKMSEMMQLKKALSKSKLEVDSSKQIIFNKAIQDLEDADKIMWDWMHGYKAQIVDTSSIEIALKYLEEQKDKVDIVDLKIKESLKNGYEILEK